MFIEDDISRSVFLTWIVNNAEIPRRNDHHLNRAIYHALMILEKTKDVIRDSLGQSGGGGEMGWGEVGHLG